jgi:hypothetical protein
MTPPLEASPPAYVPRDPSTTGLDHVVAAHRETLLAARQSRWQPGHLSGVPSGGSVCPGLSLQPCRSPGRSRPSRAGSPSPGARPGGAGPGLAGGSRGWGRAPGGAGEHGREGGRRQRGGATGKVALYFLYSIFVQPPLDPSSIEISFWHLVSFFFISVLHFADKLNMHANV